MWHGDAGERGMVDSAGSRVRRCWFEIQRHLARTQDQERIKDQETVVRDSSNGVSYRVRRAPSQVSLKAISIDQPSSDSRQPSRDASSTLFRHLGREEKIHSPCWQRPVDGKERIRSSTNLGALNAGLRCKLDELCKRKRGQAGRETTIHRNHRPLGPSAVSSHRFCVEVQRLNVRHEWHTWGQHVMDSGPRGWGLVRRRTQALGRGRARSRIRDVN